MTCKRGKLLNLHNLNENIFATIQTEGRIGQNPLELGAAVRGVKLLDLLADLLFLAGLASQLKDCPDISPTYTAFDHRTCPILSMKSSTKRLSSARESWCW